MSQRLGDHVRLSLLGWLTTVATAFCFLPTISNQSYLVQAAALSAILVAVGIGLRAWRTPAPGVLLVQLALLVEVLVVAYGDKLKYVFLPTSKTVDGLRHDISAGLEVAQKFAAPTPKSAGLTLLVLFGIGVVAVLVDFFAAGVRRVPLTGLPLLILYTVPVTALPDGVPIYGFLPGAAAYIALLLADERDRLSHWGRLVSRTPHDTVQPTMDTSGLVSNGRRIAVIAVTSAVVLPVFIPAFSSAWFDNGRGVGNGPGNGTNLSFSDPMVSLAQSLRLPVKEDVLVVSGPTSPEYLRLVVLDQPGPDNWSASALDLDNTLPLDRTLPAPDGVGDNVESNLSQLDIAPTDEFPTDSSFLPVPYALRNVSIVGDWAYVPRDQTVSATSLTSADNIQEYSVNYSLLGFTEEQLRASGPPPAQIQKDFGQVPDDVPAVVQNLAVSVTAGAQDAYEQAVLLQTFFRDSDQFTYDIDTSYGYGYNSMAEFLQKRRGFCQQFAATMAMMARTLDIPSRVVVGFLKPDRQETQDTYVITSHDVHAWPELYFEGLGWVRFEPTPRSGASLPAYADNPILPGGATPTASGTASSEDLRKPNPDTEQNTTTTDAGSTGGSGGGGAAPSKYWLVLVLLIAMMLLPAVLRQGVRHNRLNRPVEHAEAAEAAWMELRDHLRDLRLPWTGSMTPRARERSVAGLLVDDSDGLRALRRLALSVERSRYATAALPGADPATDVVEVMGVIDRHAERAQRFRARFLPASLLPDLRRAWQAWRAGHRRPEADEVG